MKWLQMVDACVATGAVGSAVPVLTLSGDGRVERGSSVVLQCQLNTDDAETLRSSSIAWYRRSGDVQHKLGVEDLLIADFGTTDRVTITRDTLSRLLVSNLTISGKLSSFTIIKSCINFTV